MSVRWIKLKHRNFKDGCITFYCPHCRKAVVLNLKECGYSIIDNGSGRGQMAPDFVCMHQHHGRYCEFSGPLWFIDW